MVTLMSVSVPLVVFPATVALFTISGLRCRLRFPPQALQAAVGFGLKFCSATPLMWTCSEAYYFELRERRSDSLAGK